MQAKGGYGQADQFKNDLSASASADSLGSLGKNAGGNDSALDAGDVLMGSESVDPLSMMRVYERGSDENLQVHAAGPQGSDSLEELDEPEPTGDDWFAM